MFKEAMRQAAHAYGVTLTEAQLTEFVCYHDLLLEWNEKVNLTAITEPEQVAVKHMIDSLSCYKEAWFAPGAAVIDVGTGAGFPGLPLKILRGDLQLTLIDSLNKRVKFLSAVAEHLGLQDVEVVHVRAEDGARKRAYRENFAVAVSRAVARLRVLAELCLPFVRVGGCFIALKGAQYREEMEEAESAIALLGGRIAAVETVKLPGLDDMRAVIYIEKVKKTPKIYPRKAGIPEKNPL